MIYAHSQENRTEINADSRTDKEFVNADTLENCIRINKRLEDIEVHFKFDKYNLDLDYMGNTNSLQDFAHKIDSIGISKIDSIIETVIPEVEYWSRKPHLKTNAIGLGMAIANVAAEVDLAKHWSFTLPVYYSAWHTTILLLMEISATKTITVRHLPSVAV